jgi:hypothetical protein
MWKNFLAMPMILKWLTAAGFFVCIMIIGAFFPHSIVRIMDRPASSFNWWATGAGPSMLIVAGLFSAAGVMLLKRFDHARLAYLVAWMALSISVPYAVSVTNGGVLAVSESSIVGELISMVAIGLYLYWSPGSRKYFRGLNM